MPLPWPEIRDKAIAFSREWQDAGSEQAESQSFWNDFFAVFGVPRRRIATFEESVKKLGAKKGRIDAFWKGQLVVEHKSRGRRFIRQEKLCLRRRACRFSFRAVSEVHKPVAKPIENKESRTKAKKSLKSALYGAICSSGKKRV